MAELLKVAKAMFQTPTDWNKISNSEKEECFFIFNRFFSKKYPGKSQLLNDKVIDKLVGMQLWFYFIQTQPYPKWFWSKSPKGDNNTSMYSDSEINELTLNIGITKQELDLLIDHYPDLIKEELSYYKSIKKGNK